MPDDVSLLSLPSQLGHAVPAHDPVIAVNEIQGDVLIGLPKKAQVFVFFTILDKAAFKQTFVKFLLGEVTATQQVQQQMAQIAASKKTGGSNLLPIFGFNVGFTYRGLLLLLGNDVKGVDDSFTAGAKAQALNKDVFFKTGLNDPQDNKGNLSTWRPEYLADDKIHGVMMFTGPQLDQVTNRANDALACLAAAAVAEIKREVGLVRPGLRDGHEHFGYLDGVSQPGVRGLTQRFDKDIRPNQGLPGQELLWPGMFVFGCPGQAAPTTPPSFDSRRVRLRTGAIVAARPQMDGERLLPGFPPAEPEGAGAARIRRPAGSGASNRSNADRGSHGRPLEKRRAA